MLADPRVADWLWPGDLGGPRTLAQMRTMLVHDMDHWKRHRFGPWLVRDRATRRGRGAGRAGADRGRRRGGGRAGLARRRRPLGARPGDRGRRAPRWTRRSARSRSTRSWPSRVPHNAASRSGHGPPRHGLRARRRARRAAARPLPAAAPEYAALMVSLAPADDLAPLREAYIAAVLKPDSRGAHRLVEEAGDAGVPVRRLYLEVLQPALHEVGRLWERARIGVAHEHLATQITQSVLARLSARLRPCRDRPRPPGDRVLQPGRAARRRRADGRGLPGGRRLDRAVARRRHAAGGARRDGGGGGRRPGRALDRPARRTCSRPARRAPQLRRLPEPPFIVAGGQAFARRRGAGAQHRRRRVRHRPGRAARRPRASASAAARRPRADVDALRELVWASGTLFAARLDA